MPTVPCSPPMSTAAAATVVVVVAVTREGGGEGGRRCNTGHSLDFLLSGMVVLLHKQEDSCEEKERREAKGIRRLNEVYTHWSRQKATIGAAFILSLIGTPILLYIYYFILFHHLPTHTNKSLFLLPFFFLLPSFSFPCSRPLYVLSFA